MMPMLPEIFEGMGRETDGDFVAAIMNCFRRPFKTPDLISDLPIIPGKPPPEVEKYVACCVQLSIELLRSKSTSVDSHAADLKLIQLLRKRGWRKQADEIEETVYHGGMPPAPAKANQLKFHCAEQAYRLMTSFTEQKPTKYKNGGFQEIAALLYSSVTGEGTESDEMERACVLVIKGLKEGGRLAVAREARREIIREVTATCMKEGIPAWPVHDEVITPEQYKGRVSEIMTQICRLRDAGPPMPPRKSK
jgi:hypothetical protein